MQTLVVTTMHYVRQQLKPWGLPLGIGLVLAVGAIDVLTGPEISVAIFYLLPIYLVTLFAGIWTGVVLSLISALTWLIADALAGRTYSHPLIQYWNLAVWLSIFVITASTAHFLSRLKIKLEREAQLARIDPLTEVGNRRQFYTLAKMDSLPMKCC
jgi:hypothetical protein